jgi:DNA-binding response OmpR family regulator
MSGETDFRAQILVADHDETLRELLDLSLRRSSHDVIKVASGQEALDAIRGEYFDLAILELALPDIGALEILGRLKKNNDTVPHTMILSSSGTPETIKECVMAGAKDFVVKPFNLPVLVKRIGVVLERAALDRQKA